MRKITALLAVFAVSALGSAFAANPTDSVTLSVNSSGTDTIDAVGNLSVTLDNSDFSSGAFKAAQSTLLTFSTQDQGNNSNRSIFVSLSLVSLTNLPAGVSIKMTPGDASTDAGTAGSAVTFTSSTDLSSTNPALYTAIPPFVTNGTANVAYSVAATQGFHDFTGTITYTLGTSF